MTRAYSDLYKLMRVDEMISPDHWALNYLTLRCADELKPDIHKRIQAKRRQKERWGKQNNSFLEQRANSIKANYQDVEQRLTEVNLSLKYRWNNQGVGEHTDW